MMGGYYFLNGIVLLLFLVTAVYLIYQLFARWQGDASWRLEVSGERFGRERHREPLRVTFEAVEHTLDTVRLTVSASLMNVGREQGVVTDCFGRVYLPFEQYDGARVTVRVTPEDMPRTDDYWEARLVPAKTAVPLRLTVSIRAQKRTLPQALAELPDVEFDILYHVYGRSDRAYEKTRLLLAAADVRRECFWKGAGDGRN